MSWVSENKFLTGLGAVMLVGVGTFGYLTWSAMDKYEAASTNFDTANAQLKRLQEAKPALKDANLKDLLAQQQEMTERISAFQQEMKSRVLPTEPITKVAFQDKLKDTVAQIWAKAAAAHIERPKDQKDFYLGFGKYQSSPPDDKATSALARELRAVELVMNVLIKARDLDLEEFDRDPLPEEGAGGAAGGGKKKRGTGRSEGGPVGRSDLHLKFTSDDKVLREVLVGLANHKEQLFVIRNLSVQNKVAESPPRLGGAPAAPAPVADPAAPAAPTAPTAPAPEAPAVIANESALAYVFGTEKITTSMDLEVLNIEEPKANPDKAAKPEKGGKKKDK